MAQRNFQDTRVRLSTEGQKEVIAAFLAVQRQAEKTDRKLTQFGAGLGRSFGALGRLLPALSFAGAVAGATLLTKRALDGADAIEKLQQKTGIATETISTLAFAARTADVTQDQLNINLIRGVRFLDEYDQGARSARDAVRGLFGSEKALEGLDTDTRIRRILEALGGLERGSKRTGAAMGIFGRAGAELLPLIDDLAEGGFAKAEARARALGIVIDKDLAAAARRANDALTDLRTLGEGFATRFAAGFAPGLAQAVETITTELAGGGKNGLTILGEAAANVISAIVSGFLAIGKTIAFVLNEAVINFESFGEDAKAVLKALATSGSPFAFLSNPAIAGRAAERDTARQARLKTFLDETREQIFKAFARTPTAPLKKKGGDELTSVNQEAGNRAIELQKQIAEAQLKFEQAALENELALAKAHGKLLLEEDKRNFEEGILSLQDYFARRRKTILAENEKEISVLARQADVLRKQIETEQGRPLKTTERPEDREKRLIELRQQLAKVENETAIKRLENENQLLGLVQQEHAEVRAFNRERFQAEAQLLEAQGDRFGAARAELDAQIAGMQRLAGETEIAFAARIAGIRKAGEATINFDVISTRAQDAMNSLDAARREIDLQVQQGILFQFEGQERLRSLEISRLPELREIARLMREAAITPQQVQQAREFAQAIEEIGASANRAGQLMAEFKQSVESALTADLTNFLTEGILQAKNFGDAMKGLALSVVKSLQRIAAQMIATFLISKLLGFVFGAAGGTAGGFGNVGQAAGGATAAGGGLMLGPGTATSDSIPARLSNYEFVVRAAVVKQPGMLQFLSNLNLQGQAALRGRRHGFADGGLVESAMTGSVAPSLGIGRADLTLALDDTLLLRRVAANPEFDRVIIRSLERQRKAVGNAIGIGTG